MGLMAPLLVGPEAKIKAVAEKFQIDLTGLEIVDAPIAKRPRRERSNSFLRVAPKAHEGIAPF